jgi:hypothetical protein
MGSCGQSMFRCPLATRVHNRFRVSGLRRQVAGPRARRRVRREQLTVELVQRGFGHMRASKPSRKINWCQIAAVACKPASANSA